MGLRWAGDKKLPKQPGASTGLARWSLGLGLHSGQERGSERRDPLATELREVACSLTPPDPQKHQFHGTPLSRPDRFTSSYCRGARSRTRFGTLKHVSPDEIFFGLRASSSVLILERRQKPLRGPRTCSSLGLGPSAIDRFADPQGQSRARSRARLFARARARYTSRMKNSPESSLAMSGDVVHTLCHIPIGFFCRECLMPTRAMYRARARR